MDMLTDMLGQKKITHVSGNEKNIHPGGRNFIFLINFLEIFFTFFCFFDSCFFCLFVWCFLKPKIYILIPIWIFRRVSDKTNFHLADFQKHDYFFWPWYTILIDLINICDLCYLEFDSFIHRKMKRKKRNNCLEHCSWISDLDVCNKFWN